MRHHNANRKFGREKGQRIALMRSLAHSLIVHGKITTTTAKAKELRPLVERLVTSSKRGTLVSRRSASQILGGASDAVKKLHETIAPRYAKRSGGYTRIVRLGRVGKRVVDMSRIEFVK